MLAVSYNDSLMAREYMSVEVYIYPDICLQMIHFQFFYPVCICFQLVAPSLFTGFSRTSHSTVFQLISIKPDAVSP